VVAPAAAATSAAAAAEMANTTGKKRKLDDWEPKQVRRLLKEARNEFLLTPYEALWPATLSAQQQHSSSDGS
jgi:hypothetical protein